MNKPKYQVGDRVKVDNLIASIIDVDFLELSGKYLYVVQFDNGSHCQRIVAEKELKNFCGDD